MRHIHQVATCEKLSVPCMLPHCDSLAEHGERICFAGMMFSSCTALLTVSLCTVLLSGVWAASSGAQSKSTQVTKASTALAQVWEQSWGCFSDAKRPGTAWFIATDVFVPCSHTALQARCSAKHPVPCSGGGAGAAPQCRCGGAAAIWMQSRKFYQGYGKFRRLLLN